MSKLSTTCALAACVALTSFLAGPEQVAADTRAGFVVAVDAESGFAVACIERGGTTTRAVGLLPDAPPLAEPAPAPIPDLAGWTLEVPGTTHHAVRASDTLYVAAGDAGVQIVDLEAEELAGEIAVPGALHVELQGDALHVTCADGQVRVVDTISHSELSAFSCSAKTRACPALQSDGRHYELTSTHVVARGVSGEVRTPLGIALEPGQGKLIDVEDDLAILTIRGAGVVFLDLDEG